MGGCYSNAVKVRTLVGQVFVGKLAAVFAHCDHTVPTRQRTDREVIQPSDMNREHWAVNDQSKLKKLKKKTNE